MIKDLRLFSGLAVAFLFFSFNLTSCTNTDNDSVERVENETPVATPELMALDERIKENPNNSELYYNRALFNLEAGLYKAAIDDLNKAIELEPSRAHYHIKLSDIYLLEYEPKMMLPDSRRALKILQDYLQKHPDNAEVHLELGSNYIYVEHYKEAITHLNEALKLKNYNPDGYYMRGIAYKYMGDTARAVANFQNTLELDPEYYDAHFELGLLFSARKNRLAESYFNNAIRIDSTNLDAYYAKGMYFQETGQFEKAIETYRQLVLKDKHYRNAFYNLGYIYNELDSLDKAFTNFDLAIKVSPDYADAFYMKGYVAERKGDLHAAGYNYRQALNLTNDRHELADLGLKRINNK